MKKISPSSVQMPLRSVFNDAASPAVDKPQHKASHKKDLHPVSIRVTAEEKTLLLKEAGDQSVASYIRNNLFGESAEARAKRYNRKTRNPDADMVMVGQLLGKLGQSEMTQALFALLLAAESGKAELPDSSLQNLDRACGQIEEMRDMLIIALGVKPQGQRRR